MKKRVVSILVTGLFILMANSSAYAIDWSAVTNLLTNPGAELGDLTGWTFTGPMYATTSQAQSTGIVLPYDGNYFFSAAGTSSPEASLTQVVDLSGYSSAIDSGSAFYNVGTWFKTEYYLGSYDTFIGMASFYNGLSGTGDILHSAESEEEFNTEWTLSGDEGLIPVGARSVMLKLRGITHSGTYANAFFDDAFMKVAVVPEPATMSLLGLGLLGVLGLRKKKTV